MEFKQNVLSPIQGKVLMPKKFWEGEKGVGLDLIACFTFSAKCMGRSENLSKERN